MPEKKTTFFHSRPVLLGFLAFIGLLLIGFYGKQKETSPTQKSASQKKIAATNETREKLEAFRLSNVIPAVVQLQCFFRAESEPSLQGSGASVYFIDGSHGILTSAHVVRDQGTLADGCWVFFPDKDGGFYDAVYWVGKVTPFDETKTTIDGIEVGGTSFADGGVDFAILDITEPGVDETGKTYPLPDRFPDLYSIEKKTCKEGRKVEIGEKLYILGYPAIGGSSITVTEGIVSGFEGSFNEWIKTSAQIASGNSGGVAVLAEDGCLLGIPAIRFAEVGTSISEILSYSFINDFISQAYPSPSISQ